MMYVDLNPIRAKMADNLTDSDFTSIQERIKQYQAFKTANDNQNTSNGKNKSNKKQQSKEVPKQPLKLLPFGLNDQENTIPFTLFDDMELVEYSGRCLHPKKRGFIPSNQPKLLTQFNIEPESWLETIKHFRQDYAHFAGTQQHLQQCAVQHHQRWYKGMG